MLTGAFVEILNPDRARIYFLQGHGEAPPASLGQLNAFIQRQNAECYGLNLASTDTVPKDAAALCIVGAKYDLNDNELRILQDYWQRNGRLIVLIDPNANTPNLRKLINAVGIFPRNDRVQRFLPSMKTPGLMGIYRDVVGVFVPENPITKRLAGVNALLVGGTCSLFLDEAGAREADVQVRPLITAAEDYWGESDYAEMQGKGVRYDDSEDTGNPVVVAASAEKGGVRDERVDIATSRMVVVGNSAFVQDAALTSANAQGNLDFMGSVINRLLERSKLTGVAPRPVTNFTLSLTDKQLRSIALYVIVLIPAAAALLGLVMGFRRRV